MSISIEFKKTSELSDDNKRNICRLFEDVYQKPKLITQFEHQFNNTVFGYSYHGIMKDQNAIVGMYTHIPIEYQYYGNKQMFGLSVDTMIASDYRGNPMNLVRMANAVYEAEKIDNIPFVFGFPNDNFYLIKKKAMQWKDIGTLDYYVMPFRLDRVDKKLRVVNRLIGPMRVLYSLIVSLKSKIDGNDNRDTAPIIEKHHSRQYKEYRYSLFPVDYRIVNLDERAYLSYLTKPFYSIHPVLDKMKIAFLLDVYPMQKHYFERAVNHISQNEPDLDMIVFLGKINFVPRNIFKVPKRREPKIFRMSGKVLIEGIVDERMIFDISNWNVNLADFDII